MSNQPSSDQQELTPEARAIIQRARRSFLFSIGLLIVGFLAIGGVLIYRATRDSGSPPTGNDYVIAALKIPDGADVVSAVAADGKVTVTYKLGAMTSVRIFDGRSGAMLREVPVVSE
jgi:hypothetical protein